MGKEECKDVPRTECQETTNQQCRPVTKQKCSDVPKLQCHQVPKVECREVSMQSCHQVPVQDCRDKPRKLCFFVPSIRVKEVTDSNVLSLTSRDVNPPRTLFVMMFHLDVKSVTMCPRRFARTSKFLLRSSRMTSSARMSPSRSVSQPRDRSVMTWWSRCPGPRTRLSAPPSIWRNVLLVIIELVHTLHFSKCNLL